MPGRRGDTGEREATRGRVRSAGSPRSCTARPAGSGGSRIRAGYLRGSAVARLDDAAGGSGARGRARGAAATPTALRRLAEAAEPGALEGQLATAVDRAIAAQPELSPPTSPIWTLLGIGQTLNLALLVFAVAWIVLWVLLRPPVGSIDVPVLGPIPVPFVLLAAGLIIGLPRAAARAPCRVRRARWAGRLAARLRSHVDAAITDAAFAAVDRLEVARRALWVAAREAEAAGR